MPLSIRSAISSLKPMITAPMATIAAMARPIGAPIAPMASERRPRAVNAGARAAAIPAAMPVNLRSCGLLCESERTISAAHLTNSVRASRRPLSPMAILRASAALASSFIAPLKPFIWVSAIRWAVPPEFSRSPCNSRIAPEPCSSSDRTAGPALWPNMVMASPAVRPASSRLARISVNERVAGLTSSSERPRFSMALAIGAVGEASRVSAPRSAVPAMLA